MKKFFLLSLMAVVSMVAMAQDDEYAAAVKDYVTTCGGQVDISELDPAMLNEMTTICVEEYKANGVTLDEINQMKAFFSTDEGKTYLQHSMQMQSPETQKKMQEAMMPAMTPLFMGGDAKKVKTPDVSASYKEKLHKMYVAQNMSSMFDSVFGAMAGMLGDSEEGAEIMKKMQDFIIDQGEAIVLVMADGNLTETDLDYGLKMAEMPASKKINKATASAMSRFLQSVMAKAQQQYQQ